MFLDGLLADEEDLTKHCGTERVQRVKTGLQHWVDGGKRRYLQWGILHLRKA